MYYTDAAEPIASALIEKLRGISDPPEEVQVEFGLSLSAEASAVLASASTSAHYRVTLRWERAAEPPADAGGASAEGTIAAAPS